VMREQSLKKSALRASVSRARRAEPAWLSERSEQYTRSERTCFLSANDDEVGESIA
jgi:hypothetical protein